MKKLFLEDDFKNARNKDLLPLICYHCNNTFFLSKKQVKYAIDPNRHDTGTFCSKRCLGLSKLTWVQCANCEKVFSKRPSQIKRSTYHFCSNSCAGFFNSQNKKFGSNRSKLEIWIEEQLTQLHPNLEIHFNRKDAIKSELDIYIPSLGLAFELNGIFHYEPIFGLDKLNKMQNNDDRKFQACLEKNIELCVIDTSQQRYFKESKSQVYLNIILNIINNKICES